MSHWEREPHMDEIPDILDEIVDVRVEGDVLVILGVDTETVLRIHVESAPFLASMILAEWSDRGCDCGDCE